VIPSVLHSAAVESTARIPWLPNDGPQADAYFSSADVLLYGGQGGGGKSSLLLGLALTRHQRSLIMRREYTELNALTEEAIKFNGTKDGFSGASPPRLRARDGRLIEFGACKNLGDEQSWQGQPHDLLGFDEAVQFLEAQVRFLLGWVRSVDESQRKRAVLATNPPVTASGQFIVGMFRPWLDLTHPRPAKPGELRWFVTVTDEGKARDLEVDGPEPVEIAGATLVLQSRTFIPAALKDNPFLVNTGYQSQLDALPEPYRSAVRDGNFMAARKDDARQVIPTAWVLMAQERWTKSPPPGVPMCAMGVDASGGGDDPMVIAARYDGWFAPMIAVPGKDIPFDRAGAFCGGVVVQHRRNSPLIVVDMGGGYGGPMYEHLKTNGLEVRAYRGAERTEARTRDRQLKFVNTRSMAIWRFREALDPSQPGGSPIALPDDPLLTADLTAPLFEIGPNGIKVESKEDVCARLGRSTDRGDAVVMAWAYGDKIQHQRGGWPATNAFVGGPGEMGLERRRPQVVTSRMNVRIATGRWRGRD
jgi:hypothetical protein